MIVVDNRTYTKPFLNQFQYQFEDVCLLCQEQRFRDASMLLLECLREYLNVEYNQNLLYLQYRTEVYLKAFLDIPSVDMWVCSDYIHSISDHIRTGKNPYVFLADKTRSLREALRSLESSS